MRTRLKVTERFLYPSVKKNVLRVQNLFVFNELFLPNICEYLQNIKMIYK